MMKYYSINIYVLIQVGAWLFCVVPVMFPDGAADSKNINKDMDEVTSAKIIDFESDAELRDPFWPVGYRRPIDGGEETERTTTSTEQRKKALSALRYGGSMRSGGRHYAIVNGSLVQEGDVLAVNIDNRIFNFQVKSIHIKSVEFKAVD